MRQSEDPYLGQVLSGNFQRTGHLGRRLKLRLTRVIGEGQFARIYEAFVTGLQKKGSEKRVAVKILKRRTVQAERRFFREIKVMQELPPHPNRVDYEGHGMLHKTPWMAMEYVDGVTLRAFLDRKKRLPTEDACRLMVDLCAGFAGLHRLGLTHRDIKPDNIMLERPLAKVKLMDFGLVQDSQGLLSFFEQADILAGKDFVDDLDQGLVAGTPEFMAPEQITDSQEKDPQRHQTDVMADVYALGVIFYELLTQEPLFPFSKGALGKEGKEGVLNYLAYRTAFKDADLSKPEAIDDALWSILKKSLSRDPDSRQRNAMDLAADLEFYLSTGQGVSDEELSATMAAPIDLERIVAAGEASTMKDKEALIFAEEEPFPDSLKPTKFERSEMPLADVLRAYHEQEAAKGLKKIHGQEEGSVKAFEAPHAEDLTAIAPLDLPKTSLPQSEKKASSPYLLLGVMSFVFGFALALLLYFLL